MLDLVWLIPALPLAGFLILLVLGRRMGEPAAGWFATAMIGASFLAGVVVFAGLIAEPERDRVFVQTLFEWIPAGEFSVDVGFLVDPLSMIWVMVVTGIGALIHLYSVSYMHGDPRYSKFFVYLNLFIFSMLILVLADNFLLTFLGWEGVGACSYLLIAFWHESEANASAGKKAFVTNRIGDWGFMVAMFLTFFTFGSLEYVEVLPQAAGMAAVTASAIALLFFVGAVGKSAQVPLFVWLPDAMAGPTPVSALIHAATMVTAGVYLMVRINPILDVSYDWVPLTIAWIGVITALVAASIAIAQNDIKKVLAYSTISQLGFMFLAVGTGAYVAAVFHVVTHAFFKALLFLGAGSVIHGMGDEQDMRRMGGLRKFMPVTWATFAVGWLAIAGVPPLAGFWSKDEILAFAGDEAIPLLVVGTVAAFLTAVYMSRQYFLVFHGKPRWNAVIDGPDAIDRAGEAGSKADELGETVADEMTQAGASVATKAHPEGFEPHESPWPMTVPLVVLATLALVGGGLNLPFAADFKSLEHWLEVSIPFESHLELSGTAKWLLGIVEALVALSGIAFAFVVYRRRRLPAAAIEPEILRRGWYIDQGVSWFVGGPGRQLFDAAAWFDRHVIDGAVNGVASLTHQTGEAVRRAQGGLVRSYAMIVSVGAVLLLAFILLRATI
jgi:NADH-quinone oxidoreductase subunit L